MQVWWGELISLWGTQDNPKNKTCHDEGVNRYKSHPSIRGKATDKLCIHYTFKKPCFCSCFPTRRSTCHNHMVVGSRRMACLHVVE